MQIGYARVSTGDQDLALQTDALTEAGCEKIFTDTISGAKAQRPGLQEAMDYAREGDVLVVWRLDRLGRSLRDLLDLVQKLDDGGVGLRSISESLDTTSPGGRLIFHIFGSIAEFERSLIRERTSAGLRAAKARGRTGGRPKALSESEIVEARALLSDPEITAAAVAKRLNVSRATLYRAFPGGRADLPVRGTSGER